MNRFLNLSAVTLALLLGTAGAARADVPPPNSTECTSKKAGDACVDDDMKAGVCTDSMCTELDYSDGSPPGTKTVPCLLCTAGAGTGGSAGSSGGGGCAISAPSGSVFWLVAAGLALPLVWRRRRARR